MSLMEGVVVGLVTQVDKQVPGQIKVHFTAHEQSHETDWIRIATTMAGAGRGTFFMPEVNDEVVVAFERGDARFPYVMGFLWNGADKPPSDDPHLRVIRSVNGHEVAFYDPPVASGDRGYLRIKDGHGNMVELANARITIRSVAAIDIQAPSVTINGRPVSFVGPPI